MHKSSSTTKQPCNRLSPFWLVVPHDTLDSILPALSLPQPISASDTLFFLHSLIVPVTWLPLLLQREPNCSPLSFRSTLYTPRSYEINPHPGHFSGPSLCTQLSPGVQRPSTMSQFTWTVWCSLSIWGLFFFVALSSFPSAWNDISFPRSTRRWYWSPGGVASPLECVTFSSDLSNPPFISLGLPFPHCSIISYSRLYSKLYSFDYSVWSINLKTLQGLILKLLEGKHCYKNVSPPLLWFYRWNFLVNDLRRMLIFENRPSYRAPDLSSSQRVFLDTPVYQKRTPKTLMVCCPES